MHISQHDIAQLDENTLKLLTIAADEAEQADPVLGPLWRHFKHALIRAIKERRRQWLLLELELQDALDDEEGELLPDTPDHDTST